MEKRTYSSPLSKPGWLERKRGDFADSTNAIPQFCELPAAMVRMISCGEYTFFSILNKTVEWQVPRCAVTALGPPFTRATLVTFFFLSTSLKPTIQRRPIC